MLFNSVVQMHEFMNGLKRTNNYLLTIRLTWLVNQRGEAISSVRITLWRLRNKVVHIQFNSYPSNVRKLDFVYIPAIFSYMHTFLICLWHVCTIYWQCLYWLMLFYSLLFIILSESLPYEINENSSMHGRHAFGTKSR